MPGVGQRGIAVAGFLAIALTALAAIVLTSDRVPAGGGLLGFLDGHDLVEPQGDVLPLPPPGEASPAWLPDGRPVFVTQTPDGDVHVLEAIDQHLYPNEMVLWCETSGWFEEPRHGSRFDLGGRWVGGPSPSGLLRFDVVVDRPRGVVAVGDERGWLPREVAHDQRIEPWGPSCIDEDDAANLVNPARHHARGEGSLFPIEEVVRLEPGRYVVDVVFDRDQQLVCSVGRATRQGCPPGSPFAATRARGITRELLVVQTNGEGGIDAWTSFVPVAHATDQP